MGENNDHKKTQLSYLNENNYSLKIILSKMLQRSLDLLRHDRVESFDALSTQLKTEYKIVNDDVRLDLQKDTLKTISDAYFTNINESTHDLVFKSLLRKMLLEEKVLLTLDLDKTKMKPYEEVIEFLSDDASATSAWVKKFEKQKKEEEDKNGAKETLNSSSKKNANLISEQKQNETIELNKPVNNIQLEKSIESTSTKMIKTSSSETQKVKNPDEQTVESLNAKSEIEAKLLDTLNEDKTTENSDNFKRDQQNSLSSCGTTPPPTPQNELNQSQSPPLLLTENAPPRVGLLIEATPVKLEERIILNTIKEPPIVFESEREGYVKKDVVAAADKSSAVAPVQPLASSPSLNKNKEQKKTNGKKSSFCGLSCTGAKADKSENKTKAKKDKKKVNEAAKEAAETKPQVVTVEKTAENITVNFKTTNFIGMYFSEGSNFILLQGQVYYIGGQIFYSERSNYYVGVKFIAPGV
jgi:hypothetical protein